MTAKEHFLEHLKKAAEYHRNQADEDEKISKSTGAIGEAHTDAVLGQHFRDLSGLHGRRSKNHTDHARHLLNLHENLSANADAELFDSHTDAGDDLKTAAGYGDLLKSMRLVAE